MQEKNISQAGINGVLLEQDAMEALFLRKCALTMGAILQSCSFPEEFVSYIRNQRPEFVLIDCCHALPDNLDLMRDIVRLYPNLPILVILPSGADEQLRDQVLTAGAWDFFIKPFNIREFQLRVQNAVRVSRIDTDWVKDSIDKEDEIRDAIGEILLREYETLYILGKASEYKDEETGSHIVRVANYSRLLARMMGEDKTNQDVMYHSSALHDIGKIGIPDSVLLKPGRLDDGEIAIMRTHSTNGHGILENAASSYLLTGAMIALTHHERFDGTGYPMQLSGYDIPLYGRIVCVADVFDALTTRRPYKKPWSLDMAFDLLRKERGKQFDPELVDAFLYNSTKVVQIYRDNSELKQV